VPDDVLYTRDHQWVRPEGDLARVGLSAFAQGELGEIAYVELPAPGRTVRAGEAVAAIDSMKSTSEITAPVSGTIVEVNKLLESAETVGLVNRDPLGEGWLFVVRMVAPGETADLLTADEYQRYVTGS
jgi:glycine cleavage system H protein